MKKCYQMALAVGVLGSIGATIVQAGVVYDDFVQVNDTNGTVTSVYLNNGSTSPNQDWFIGNNYLGSGEFSIIDNGDGLPGNDKSPLVIQPGAPDYSIFIDPVGRLGLGTLTPGGDLRSKLTVTEDDVFGYSSIYLKGTTQDYYISNFGDSYRIVDGKTLDIPFRIDAGAPNDSLVVSPGGNVGVGTAEPKNSFHVKVDDDSFGLPFLVENTGTTNFSGFRLQIGPNDWIDFNNSGGDFRINADQVPGPEFEVRPNGDATLAGALTQNSDINAKRDIVNINNDEVLAKVVKLPITEWSYKDNPYVRHVGPMAQDFHSAFGLGESPTGLSTIDTGGIALAAIKGLKQQKDRQIAHLEAELQKQEDRVLQLELVVAELLRNQTENIQVGSVQ